MHNHGCSRSACSYFPGRNRECDGHCSKFTCRFFKVPGRYWCKGHGCAVRGCHTETPFGQALCNAHKCQMEDCHNAAMNGSRACLTHRCAFVDGRRVRCPKVKRGDLYCESHGCSRRGCRDVNSGGGSPFCLGHRCNKIGDGRRRCPHERLGNSIWCDAHLCTAILETGQRCPSGRLTGEGHLFCGDHKCKEGGCPLHVWGREYGQLRCGRHAYA